MAITQVRAQINGTWYTLSATGASGQYTATVTAPGATSYNNPGGYYNITVEAVNSAGTTGTAAASTLDGLKFYVRETVPPVVTISPRPTAPMCPITGSLSSSRVTDETGGSGVDLDSVAVKLDGRPYPRRRSHTRPSPTGTALPTPLRRRWGTAHTVSVEACRQRRQHGGGEEHPSRWTPSRRR